jgi:hypothetical protein
MNEKRGRVKDRAKEEQKKSQKKKSIGRYRLMR